MTKPITDFKYVPSVQIDWSIENVLTELSILADYEDEPGGFSTIVPLLRWIVKYNLVPNEAGTINERDILQASINATIVTWDWDYFYDHKIATFLSFLDDGLLGLEFHYSAPSDRSWRAYINIEQAYLYLFDAYLSNEELRNTITQELQSC